MEGMTQRRLQKINSGMTALEHLCRSTVVKSTENVQIKMLTTHVSTDLVDEAHSVLLPLAQADDAAGAHAHACRPHRRQRREPVLRSSSWQEGIRHSLSKGRLISATFARLTRRT